MNTLKKIQFKFQSISWRSLLGVFLAGMLVVVSTACSATKAATPANSSQYNSSPNTVIQPGDGMYPHSDTERDTSAADAKAKQMIREAKQRTQSSQGLQGYVDEITPDKSLDRQAKELGQSAQQVAEDVGESTKQALENAADNTQKSFQNLKQTTQKALEQASDAIDRATEPS